MDVKIDSAEGKFKFRVCGILEHNGKYLAVKMNNNNFYCFPGGHVELGEDTQTAVLREMHEELGYEVIIKKLVAINENFFLADDGFKLHEIGYYYVVEAKDKSNVNFNDYLREELDKGKIQHLNFKWFTLDELRQADFRPKFVIDCINANSPIIKITKD